MFTRQFLTDTAERAASTFFQVLLVLIGSDAVNLFTLDWTGVLAASASAAILSVVKAVAAGKLGNAGTASLSKATLPAPPRINAFENAIADAQEAIDKARRQSSIDKLL